MCFTEYIGYTCGHTSLSVKRPCPLTTQLFNNPVCPGVGAARPILAESLCPACSRIIHGRCVNIIENEHRFMHARGACPCPVRFPHLMQPRVISPDDNVGPAGDHPGAEGETTSGGAAVPAGAGDANEAENNGRGRALSAAASVFSPSPIATLLSTVNSSLCGVGSFTTRFDHPAYAQDHQTSSYTSMAGGASNAPSFGDKNRSTAGPNPGASAAAIVGDKGSSTGQIPSRSNLDTKGKGKQKAEPQPQHQYQYQNGSGGNGGKKSRKFNKNRDNRRQPPFSSTMPLYHTNPTPASVPASSSASTALVRTSTQGSGGDDATAPLAPLWEETRDTDTHTTSVAVRMVSLYGAEWLQDHAALHRDGRCTCDVSFERYPRPYMDMLREGIDAETETETSAVATASTTAPTAPAQVGTDGSQPYPYSYGSEAPTAPDAGSWGMTTAHQAPETAQTPSGYGYAVPVFNAFQSQRQAQAQPHAQAQAQAEPLQQHQWPATVSSLGDPSTLQPARWAYSPDNGGSEPGDPARPVDMQTVWFNRPPETPLAGLPLGAGPEGAPHFLPFEDCELYYPKPSSKRHRSYST
ncbi:hypothetical protein GGS23DRAFT_597831 [Durotheca rogersii]|uniref:uncharacterized protein n=1 Tax=Durotheca rogersii TaxID=419775 RepID=UPI00221F91DC|nr:uncharacterized protein GGS23DRAFT_597831 [Durotheca rogersii]KAI5862216.1 hypothetical protein GGS23DRAFT_597831 [Durotheca rogersii]